MSTIKVKAITIGLIIVLWILYIRGGSMTEEEAKEIILDDPNGDIVKRMEAIAVARSVLGENCTMKEVWKWAESPTKEV